MKNIHVLPTNKKTRLVIPKYSETLLLADMPSKSALYKKFHIYITSNSKFVRDEYITDGIEVIKATPKLVDAQDLVDRRDWNKIIITTDQELIKDGVHSIGEEFLKWFVENPTCIKVEVVYGLFNPMGRQVDPNDLGQNHSKCIWKYKIITTKEETKQFFTDYPITELGDEEFKEAPIRQCKLISYDNNKYCYVKVEGIEKEIKRVYIYTKPGRCGEVDCISIDEIKELMKEEPKQETLEEAAEKFRSENPGTMQGGNNTKILNAFKSGVKWQQEPEQFFSDDRVKTLEKSIEYLLKRQERSYSEEEVKHLMTLSFEQGFKKADVVEAGLEAKETDTEVNWIFLKHKK